MKYLIFITIVLFSSCNPCKYVSKHPECFPADTVIKEKEVIKHVTEYITNDSIVRDTVPCDPITKTYVKTNTVYRTKTIRETDTIKTVVNTSKINPVNNELKKKVNKLENKVEAKNKWLKILGGILALFLLIIVVLVKFK
jgi:hypothetical protein